jgi:hypothetical protein
MDRQSVLREALGQNFHYPSGIIFALKTDDKVIGEPHDKTVPAHPWLHFVDEPLIQYMVEEYIRKAG